MKKPININLFVSCPQNSETLNNQKVALAKWLNELEVDFANANKKEKEVDINTVIYSVPENRKQVGEKNIKKADIAIFLFDDKPDDVLVNELKLAVERSKKFREPELFVFFSKKAEENQDIKQIKQILVDGGWIPEPLTNTQKLLDNVKEKIHQYVRSQKSIHEIRRWSKFRYYGLLIGGIILAILIPLSIWLSIKLDKAESKRLLIVGGGSARNFIENSLLSKKNGLSTKYWIYTNMPSGEAYRLLAEENMNYTKDFDSLPYYPVIISAQKAKGEESFCEINNVKKKQLFKDRGIIIGIYIGNDNLVVYGSNDAFNDIQIGQDSTITNDALNSIIAISKDSIMYKKTPPIMIYTTKNKSGTKNAYDSVCKSLTAYDSICDSRNIDHLFFNIDSITGQKTKNKWLTLGSEYYSPKENKNRLMVVNGDEQHTHIYKQLYVYFMMYKDGDNYRLPNATEEFLKKILKKTDIGDSIIDSIKDIKVKDKILYDYFPAIK